ncbi:putative quinol monooxygenase [Mesorhizobium sp. VNQ89]|uniref:putative quinol monooxygenase n=1 Tax=Mesorhizobium quangtriensis TaxID=3157709 RepID=UPI0032B75A8C
MSVIVEYEIHDGREGDFAALMKDHARRTLFEEDGCLRFEVLEPVDQTGAPIPGRLMVSELYIDQAALTAHMESPRLAALRSTLGPLLKSRRLLVSQVVSAQAEETGLAPDELNAANDG